MSGKNNSTQHRKSRKTSVESNPSKKTSQNKPKNINPPEIHCNNCGVLLDDVLNFHYIYTDNFGELDVCEKCFDELNNETTNIPPILLPPPPPSSQPTNGIVPNVPNPMMSNVPKIRLVFINPINNTNNHLPKYMDKEKEKDKDKDKSKEKVKKDEKTGYQSSLNNSRCNSAGCSENQDDPSLLFFQQILNRLHNVDKTSCKSSNTNDECAEIDTEEEDDVPLEFEWLGDNIKTIDDLIILGKSYDSRKRKRYNLNLKQLNKLVEPLEELKAMVGMSDVKKIIFDQLIYYLQNLDDKNVDMLHTVIVGPPGVGKTQLTYIIAKIYNRLGFLKTDKVICAKRDDLIGEYIGQTAPKTRKVLERALGGVLLLDEIYSLAPTSERDFAREAIDMINMYLSEHAHDLVCVVAGYKKPTYEKFFSQNEGLARRFTHHFEIKGYTHNELALIFKKYLEGQKWQLGTSLEEVGEIIKGYMDIFPNFGGDMTTLFACCKKAHSRRLLAISTEKELESTKKRIQKNDILEAVGIYKDIKEKHSSADEEDKAKYMHMYV